MRAILHYVLIVNWKTTAIGAGVFFSALGNLLQHLATGDSSTLFHDLPIILGGFGLVLCKDAIVGGKPQ